MMITERARRYEDVGVGFTSIEVTRKKLGWVFCQGPICNRNIYKLGQKRKTDSAFQELHFRDSESVLLAIGAALYAFTETKAYSRILRFHLPRWQRRGRGLVSLPRRSHSSFSLSLLFLSSSRHWLMEQRRPLAPMPAWLSPATVWGTATTDGLVRGRHLRSG